MHCYITTRGRPKSQKTYEALLPVARRAKILSLRELHVVVYEDEYDDYVSAGVVDPARLLVRPPDVTELSGTRQWLMEYHLEHVKDQRLVLLDDDMKFYRRRDDDRGKAVNATAEDVTAMLRALSEKLHDYVHAGVLGREGANRMAEHDELYATRQVRVLGYRARDLLKLGARFNNRASVMCDFDMTLQLLRAGYPNVLLCQWWQGHPDSDAPGGCSTYRTAELQTATAHRLAELHPGYVRVVQKTTKTAWGGGTRTDVQIAWKRAYADGQLKRFVHAND